MVRSRLALLRYCNVAGGSRAQYTYVFLCFAQRTVTVYTTTLCTTEYCYKRRQNIACRLRKHLQAQQLSLSLTVTFLLSNATESKLPIPHLRISAMRVQVKAKVIQRPPVGAVQLKGPPQQALHHHIHRIDVNIGR